MKSLAAKLNGTKPILGMEGKGKGKRKQDRKSLQTQSPWGLLRHKVPGSKVERHEACSWMGKQ
jgi:hypothetical protein